MDAHDPLLPPLHPGLLLKHVLERYEIPQAELAAALGVEPGNLSTVIHGRRPVTLHLARLLAMALGTRPEFWLVRQMAFDLAHAEPLPPVALMRQLARLADSRPRFWLERELAVVLAQTQSVSPSPAPPEGPSRRVHGTIGRSRLAHGGDRPEGDTARPPVAGRPAARGRRPFESQS